MLAPFLMALTLIAGFAFGNEGGDAMVKEKGLKETVKTIAAERQVVDYSKMNK